MTSESENDIELLWGASAIAKAMGRETRQAYYLLEGGQIPARKIGNQWVAERGKLLRYLAGAV